MTLLAVSCEKSPLFLVGDRWGLGALRIRLLGDRLLVTTAGFEEMSVYKDFSKAAFVNNSTANLLPSREKAHMYYTQ